MRIGVLGAGRMGLPVIAALVAAGHEVTAFDPVPARSRAAADSGAAQAVDAQSLAASAEALVTVLPGAAEVESVLLSAGVVSLLTAGSLWLDLTSNDPRVAERVAAVAAERGVDAVAAPMAGGVGAAESRSLGFFVGGSSVAVDRARPLLAALGSADTLKLVGKSVGVAHTAKLLANLLWFGQVVAVSEALLLGQSLGLEPGPLRALLADSAGGSVFIDEHLDSLLAGDYLETFGLDRVVDELEILRELASERRIPFELSETVARLHREALARFGAVDGELLAAKLLEERAGRELRR